MSLPEIHKELQEIDNKIRASKLKSGVDKGRLDALMEEKSRLLRQCFLEGMQETQYNLTEPKVNVVDIRTKRKKY